MAASSFAPTPTGFAQGLLDALGAPDTPDNESVIVEWEQREGGNWLNNAKYNPLNTTQDEPGASSINSVGVKAYTSWAQGLAATAATLTNGLYDDIVSALQTGDQQAAVSAIEQSPWAGASGYSPSSWPTQASAAAYAKGHKGGGSSWTTYLNPITDAKKAVGAVGGVLGKGGSAAAGAVGDAVGGAFGAVWDDAKPFLVTMAFAGLGLSLVALGGWQAAKGKVSKATQSLEIAPAAGGGGKAGSAAGAGGSVLPEAAAAAV